MDRWRCGICEYIYDPMFGDPGNSVAPGTSYLILPNEWCCPICGSDKDYFEQSAVVVSAGNVDKQNSKDTRALTRLQLR